MSDFKVFCLGSVIFVLIIALLCAGIEQLEKASFPAKLESIREAVEHLGCNASEDVIGQALDANKTIANYHYWNGNLVGWFFSPNRVADAKPIEIPNCR